MFGLPTKTKPLGPAAVGLLAGWGRLPILFAQKARKIGLPVVCVGLRDEASPEMETLVDRFYWTGIGKLARMIGCFKREGVERVVMAGKFHKVKLNASFRVLRYVPDWRMIKAWWLSNRRDNKDDTLLLQFIDEFAKDGLTFASALDFCPELLMQEGVRTKRKPTASEEADIAFGWELAKEMGRLDVGQSVAVREQAVLAVEAIEGTDQAIVRAGQLCPRGGIVVVKVAKPQQDLRFDVPTIGCQTVESMHKAGARVLAIEADKTIVIDEDQTIALADRYGISIVAKAA